jgi:hypothetical protein
MVASMLKKKRTRGLDSAGSFGNFSPFGQVGRITKLPPFKVPLVILSVIWIVIGRHNAFP